MSAAEKHLTPRATKRRTVREHVTLETIFDAEGVEDSGPRVEPTQASVGGEPEIAAVVF